VLQEDFVVGLPELLMLNIVITIVDPVSKKAHFILTHTTATVKSIVLELKIVNFVFILFYYLDLELGL